MRPELAILRRHGERPKLTRADRALLAALSRSLTRSAWTVFSFKPNTLLRWHRQLVARRWTYPHRPPGRPPLKRSLRELILRLADDNPDWGYKRIVGELKSVGITVSATSVRNVLLEAGLLPAPQRARSSWRAFLRALASSMLACDFLTVETAFLQRIYVLFFISLGPRRIEYIACCSIQAVGVAGAGDDSVSGSVCVAEEADDELVEGEEGAEVVEGGFRHRVGEGRGDRQPHVV